MRFTIHNVIRSTGHEGEDLCKCTINLDGVPVATWEILDWGGGTMITPLENSSYDKECGRTPYDLILNGTRVPYNNLDYKLCQMFDEGKYPF
jgi:hypothetical protein